MTRRKTIEGLNYLLHIARKRSGILLKLSSRGVMKT
jgi:hypothetical protein